MCDDDLIYTKKNVLIITSLGFLGGFLAGVFGLGGGVIYHPILLTMGLQPQVSAVCSLYLVGYGTMVATAVNALHSSINY